MSIQPPFSGLETPRLRLRHFREQDLPTLLAYRNDPDVARYQSWESMTEDFGHIFISEMSESHPGMPGYWFQFAIELRATGAHIGDCALHTRGDDARLGEIGYTLAPAFQGQGLAYEATAAMLDYAFTVQHMHRISATVDVRNDRSITLLKRLGMRCEGHFLQCAWFHGEWCDEYLYAILSSEWTLMRATNRE